MGLPKARGVEAGFGVELLGTGDDETGVEAVNLESLDFDLRVSFAGGVLGSDTELDSSSSSPSLATIEPKSSSSGFSSVVSGMKISESSSSMTVRLFREPVQSV